jgi:hypothetical protein
VRPQIRSDLQGGERGNAYGQKKIYALPEMPQKVLAEKGVEQRIK